MKTFVNAAIAIAVSSFVVASSNADDKKNRIEHFGTRLSSYNEVHFVTTTSAGNVTSAALRGAISSGAKGSFNATLDKAANLIHYVLEFEALESDVRQAHIHFGQRHTVGGIVVWLCETTQNPAPTEVQAVTPQCDDPNPRTNTIRGTIAPSQVLAPAGQGFVAGDFEKLIAALRAGATYANVHTATFTPGEIRGQVRRDQGRERD